MTITVERIEHYLGDFRTDPSIFDDDGPMTRAPWQAEWNAALNDIERRFLFGDEGPQ